MLHAIFYKVFQKGLCDRLSRISLSIGICCLICNLLLAPALAAEPQSPKGSSKSSSPNAQAVNIPIPIGEPVRGIRVPHYTDEGKLSMQFDAETAQKIDETHVEMENLTVQVFEDEKKPMKVILPKSVLNTDTQIVSSRNGVVIEREDFRIDGDTGQFNIHDRLGKLGGNIKMVIYSMEDFE